MVSLLYYLICLALTAMFACQLCSTSLAYHSSVLSARSLYRFVIDARYVPTKGIGRGAYGVVVSATDVDTGHRVAIKKIPRLFYDLVDAKRILREIKLLRHFNHENVIGLRDIAPPYGDFEELFIVLDYMDTDLHKIIYSSNQLTDEHIQYFLYQILRGLKYIHSANVIHRDLKPSNLLLNANCHLKICDFGLARGFQEQDYMTEYVVTRWYRAPEIMCSCDAYDYKIDVWSTGCILAELLTRSPLFPGEDYKQQLSLIFTIIGTPTAEDTACITNEFALQYILALPARQKVPFSKLMPGKNPLALDLLEKMLTFNPKNRISVDEALAHPYLKDLHDPKIEVVCEKPWNHDFEADLADNNLTKERLQEFMWDELYHFRPALKGKIGRGRNCKKGECGDIEKGLSELRLK